MSIKDKATTYADYYKILKENILAEQEEAVSKREKIIQEKNALHNSIKENTEVYKDLGIDLLKYDEFTNNQYSVGKFYKVAKGAFINRKGEYELTTDLYDLYQLASLQKEEHELTHKISIYSRILALNGTEYNKILRVFYNEVARHLILYGEGYSFEGRLGWLCINRCKLVNARPKLDYNATAKRKEELLKKGVRLWNKEEKEWCEKNGLPYDGVDYRVYLKKEYCYEIPLIMCTLADGYDLRFESADYRGASLRGKTNDDILKETKGDLEAIVQLPLDIKTKLNICDKASSSLYLNFIRNENQKPFIYREADRKNR